MESKKFKENDIIIKQGDTIDSASFVYFLMNGTVAVLINDIVSIPIKAPQYNSASILAQINFSI